MKKTIEALTAAFLFIIFVAPMVFAAKPPDDIEKVQALQKAYRMSIPFIENRGQLENSNVSFYAKTFGGTLFVDKNGILTYSLSSGVKGGVVIKEIITDKKLDVKGIEPSPTQVNYFKGNDRSKWRTNIPSYNSVFLGEVYRGVELTLKAYGKNVEKIFTVSPGENPEQIKIKLEGAKKLRINEKGELEVLTKLGPVKFTKPYAYQDINGKRIEITVAYTIRNPKSEIKNVKVPQSAIRNTQLFSYGFKVASYDKSEPLVIDPLLASTFIGGTNFDRGYTTAISGSGDVYVAGYTWSADYPATTGNTINGIDAFVSKLDSDLSSLEASTFIGGNDADWCNSIVLGGDGNVYVTGDTGSTNFPTTSGAYNEDYNGGIFDVFVSKLNSTLSSLLKSTFIGGEEAERGFSIALVENGDLDVYVTGITRSSDYPTTSGAYDQSFNDEGSNNDAFVSRFNSDLSNLEASTFIGGGGDDAGKSMAFDKSGNVYVTGYTWSSNYPVTTGAYDVTYNGTVEYDAFVSKLTSDLRNLLASTFIGGGSSEYGTSLTLDGSGNVLVAGRSGSSNYPTTPGAYDESHNGQNDAFVSKFNSNLSSLLKSTFIGGSGSEWCEVIALDGCGNVYLTGDTSSSNYPTTTGAYDDSFNSGLYDCFITKLDSTLSFLFQSTFIGGSGSEVGKSLALDRSGNVYVTGKTSSSDYPDTTGAYDESFNDVEDVFVSKLDSDLSADGSGFQPASAPFQSSSTDLALKFDVDQDGKFEIPCTKLLLCDDQDVMMDIWLDNWSGGAPQVIAYNFSVDPAILQLVSVTCEDWNTCTFSDLGSGVHRLEAANYRETGSEDFKLHTLQLKCGTVDTPDDTPVTIDNVYVDPPNTVGEGQLTVYTICGGEPLECTEEDPCDILDGDDYCSSAAIPYTGEADNSYQWEPLDQEDPALKEGDIITIFRNRWGRDEVTVYEPLGDICDSTCFNQCFESCSYVQLQPCIVGCMHGSDEGVCPNWDIPEVCYEYDKRINCNLSCNNDCINNDTGTQSYYDKRCGFTIHETISLKDGPSNCTGTLRGTTKLIGAGTVKGNLSLPIETSSGTHYYDLCVGTTPLDTLTVEALSFESACSIAVPENVFIVDHRVTKEFQLTLFNHSLLERTYNLDLDRVGDEGSGDYPGYLTLSQTSVTVGANSSETVSIRAANSHLIGRQIHWPQIKVTADNQQGNIHCETYFDFDIRNISANSNCLWDNEFSQGDILYGRAFLEGLDPDTPYDLYVVKSQTDWTDGMPIFPWKHSTTFTTDDKGDMACGTLLWNTTNYGGTLPASFDIVIDVNGDGNYDAGTDYLDANGGVGFLVAVPGADTDGDGISDANDNCPATPNTYQSDFYPPGGNNCGDACECEGNFDGDADQDGGDAAAFKSDFGRSQFQNPCTNEVPCNGDFTCDNDVDGADAALFKADFGRSSFQNPCPFCPTDPWCDYNPSPVLCDEANDCEEGDCCGYASSVEVGSGDPLYCTPKIDETVCYFCNSQSDCMYSNSNTCCCSSCPFLGSQESLCMPSIACSLGCQSTCLP